MVKKTFLTSTKEIAINCLFPFSPLLPFIQFVFPLEFPQHFYSLIQVLCYLTF